jgi:acid stress chaperone HdeB
MKTVRAYLAISGTILVLPLLSFASAQVQVESKVTCDQLVHGKLGQPRTIAAWLSGFYNGKRDSTILDIQNFENDLNKLQNFCYQEKNFEMPVMQAIEQILAKTK